MDIRINMIDNKLRPLINIKIGGKECIALVDTGAVNFVWVSTNRDIASIAKPTNKTCILSGLGGKGYNDCKVWESTVRIGGLLNYMTIMDVPIVEAPINRRMRKFDVILPYTALHNCGFEVQCKGDKRVFTIHNVEYKYVYKVQSNDGLVTNIFLTDVPSALYGEDNLTLDI